MRRVYTAWMHRREMQKHVDLNIVTIVSAVQDPAIGGREHTARRASHTG